MIDGNLAVKADAIPAAEPCEGATCQWPSGCWRGRYRLVAMPAGGRLWLCRSHAASLVKASAAVLATRNRRAKHRLSRDEARAVLRSTRGRSVAVTKESIPAQAAPSTAAVRPALKPEPSPGVWTWLAEWGLHFAFVFTVLALWAVLLVTFIMAFTIFSPVLWVAAALGWVCWGLGAAVKRLGGTRT